MPDDRFTSDGAIQMFFPDHNPGLWEVGNKVTMAVAEPLYSYYKPGIDSAAPKVYQLMSSMQLDCFLLVIDGYRMKCFLWVPSGKLT
jgi:hypothetical protein